MLLRRIFAIDLVRFFSSGALLTLLKLIAALCVNKAIALSVGPSGYGEIAQLLGSIATFVAITSAPTGNGLVRYVAECKKNGDDFSVYILGSVILAIILSFIVILVFFVWQDGLRVSLFYGSPNYAPYFNIFLFFLPIASFSLVIPSYLNGSSRMMEFVLFSTRSYLGYILLFLGLYLWFGLDIALYVAAASATILSIFYGLQSIRLKLVDKKTLSKIRYVHLKNLTKYSLMAIASTACAGGSQIILRQYAANEFDWSAVGNWQAISRLSDAYLSFVFMGLSTYILPKLIASKTDAEKIGALKHVLYAIIVFFTFVSIFYMSLYKEVLDLLYSDKFDLPEDAVLLQIMGDFFKCIAWLLTYVIIANGKAIRFIFIEVTFTALGLISSIYMINIAGFIGIFQAYLLTNLCAAAILYALFKYGKL